MLWLGLLCGANFGSVWLLSLSVAWMLQGAAAAGAEEPAIYGRVAHVREIVIKYTGLPEMITPTV